MLTAFLGLIILLIPVNLVGNATTDASYIENIDSLVSVEGTTITEGESVVDIKNDNISVGLIDVFSIEDTNKYKILVSKGDSVNLMEMYRPATLGTTNVGFVMLSIADENEQDEQDLVENTNDESNTTVNNVVESTNENNSNVTENTETTETIIEQPNTNNQNALVQIANPDPEYKGQVVKLSASDRDLLERLVMGEAGGEGFEGAALVAQTLRDHMVYHGYTSVDKLRRDLKYSGSIKKQPNEDVKKAVAFIFDEGGVAVQHKIYYFYAPRYCEGKWHNTQEFILEYGCHRFFCKWGE